MAKSRIDVQISPEACILAALMLLVLPFPWIAGALIAAVVHELFHLAALFLCDVKVFKIQIGSCGAVIATGPVTRGRELVCTLAGPAGSLFLLLFARPAPTLAFCGLIQGCFNLLPIFPLDGGRAMQCFLQLIYPGHADAVFCAIEAFTVILLSGLGFAYCWMLHWHLGIALVILFVIHRVMGRKIPCKAERKRVQ